MWSRLGKVFILTVPLAVAGMLAGAEPAACISCVEQTNWVCCMPSADECDSWRLDYCNDVGTDNPFEAKCGWVE